MRYFWMLRDEKGDGDGDGGGEKISISKADFEAMQAKIKELETKKTEEKPDGDLAEKARLMNEEKDRKNQDVKYLEAAIQFNMNSEKFLKDNQSLLPKDIADIFSLAEKEKYDNQIQKANALKAGVIQSFFSRQENVDLLTPGLKNQLEEYLKLTKNKKEEEAQKIYDAIFEPAFDTLKRVKKAEALAKGHGQGTPTQDAYKQKMIQFAEKQYNLKR